MSGADRTLIWLELVGHCSGSNAANMLDEHQLDEPVRFAIVFIMVSLTNFTDLCELSIAECAATLAESLERVF